MTDDLNDDRAFDWREDDRSHDGLILSGECLDLDCDDCAWPACECEHHAREDYNPDEWHGDLRVETVRLPGGVL